MSSIKIGIFRIILINQSVTLIAIKKLEHRVKEMPKEDNPTTQLNVLITIYCGYSCIKNTIFGAIVAKLRCRDKTVKHIGYRLYLKFKNNTENQVSLYHNLKFPSFEDNQPKRLI